MKTLLRSVLGAATLCLALSFPFASAHAGHPITLRMGHPMAPGSSVAVGYEKFKELVEEKSGQAIQIQIFGDCQLGSDRAATEMARDGALDMSSSSTSNLASFNSAYMVLDLPFLLDPVNQARFYQALDSGELGQALDRLSLELGLKTIMFSDYGYRNFVSTDKPLDSVSSLEGIKIRTSESPVDRAIARALGMQDLPVSRSATYEALRMGRINGESNAFSLLYSARHGDLLKYAMDSRHSYTLHILMMNQKRWNSLKPEQQTIITEAAREAQSWQRTESAKLEAQARQAMLARGLQIHTPTAEELAELKAKTEAVRQQFSQEVPADLLALILATQK